MNTYARLTIAYNAPMYAISIDGQVKARTFDGRTYWDCTWLRPSMPPARVLHDVSLVERGVLRAMRLGSREIGASDVTHLVRTLCSPRSLHEQPLRDYLITFAGGEILVVPYPTVRVAQTLRISADKKET